MNSFYQELFDVAREKNKQKGKIVNEEEGEIKM